MMGLLANAVDPWDWTLWETPRLLVPRPGHGGTHRHRVDRRVRGAVVGADEHDLSVVSHGYGPDRPAATASATTAAPDRKSTRLNSSHLVISYAVFCLKKKKNITSS